MFLIKTRTRPGFTFKGLKPNSYESTALNGFIHFCKVLVLIHVFLSAGGDDRRVLLWHMEQAIHSRSKPVKLKGEHLSNIFCLAFDSTNKKVFSGGKRKKKLHLIFAVRQ